jgi:uncharacterized protein YegP (UPF0339 family)
MKFTVEQSPNGQWRARIIADNGEPLFVSEQYVHRHTAEHAVEVVLAATMERGSYERDNISTTWSLA